MQSTTRIAGKLSNPFSYEVRRGFIVFWMTNIAQRLAIGCANDMNVFDMKDARVKAELITEPLEMARPFEQVQARLLRSARGSEQVNFCRLKCWLSLC